MDLMQKLSLCQIPGLPGAAYYAANFMSPEEESYVLHKFSTRPSSAFRNLSHRRLQIYPGELDPKTNALASGPLPTWIEQPIVQRLLESTVDEAASDAKNSHPPASVHPVFADAPHRRPTHALLNEYPPGVGIAAHEDGPAYFPRVATVSLGSHAVLELRNKETVEGEDTPQGWRLLLEPRSLLVLGEGMYTGCLHKIDDVRVDEGLEPLTEARGVANWDLLGEGTRELLRERGGTWERRTRVSVTLRDVWKMRDIGRLLPGLRRPGH